MKNVHQERLVLLKDRFARKTVSYLSAGTTKLPHDISERLRSARVQAVSKRKLIKYQAAENIVFSGSGAATNFGSGDGWNWWNRVGSVFPLIALVVGLLTINSIQGDHRAQELAEVDAALLTDELPPDAFADPGFNQFLKSARQGATSK